MYPKLFKNIQNLPKIPSVLNIALWNLGEKSWILSYSKREEPWHSYSRIKAKLMLHSISGFVIAMWHSVIMLCVPKCLERAALSPKLRLIVILWYWHDQNTGVFPTAVLPLHHSTLLGLFRDPSPATWCQPSTLFPITPFAAPVHSCSPWPFHACY